MSFCYWKIQKQELLARETILRPAVDYSKDMTAEEQKRYINYLAERVNAEESDRGKDEDDL